MAGGLASDFRCEVTRLVRQCLDRSRGFARSAGEFILLRNRASCYRFPRHAAERIRRVEHVQRGPGRMVTSKPQTIVEMDVAERETLLTRAADSGLGVDDVARIRAVFDSYAYVSQLISQKNLSLARLRRMLFGDCTESSANVLGTKPRGAGSQAAAAGAAPCEDAAAIDAASPPTPAAAANSDTAKPRRGHGRNGADDLPGAIHVQVRLDGLVAGATCPVCGEGTLYQLNSWGTLIRFVGQAPVRATIYDLEKLRCKLCGELFTAKPPAEAGARKYDETVGSLIGILKYGHGFPFYRFAQMQDHLDVPLAASTQWDIVALASESYQPAYEELIRQAAQGELVCNDDTTAKILAWMGRRRAKTVAAAADAQAAAVADVAVADVADATVADATDATVVDAADAAAAVADASGLPPAVETIIPDLDRTGLYTTGVVAECGPHHIALFFTGRRHAGENLEEVLRRRAAELPPPIQMCDALSRNYPASFQTIVANCLAHARRRFVEVKDNFLAECEYVLGALAKVYAADAQAKEARLTPEQRLRHHQESSGPVMTVLREWLEQQVEERRTEPNSALGAAIQYLRRHWAKLTLFLRVPGAPLDNNIVERALKKAILHRKNSLFYKTERGAQVGDIHMTLIHTCELCGANPSDYLTQLQRHAAAVAAAPAAWLPWNYRDTLAPVTAST